MSKEDVAKRSQQSRQILLAQVAVSQELGGNMGVHVCWKITNTGTVGKGRCKSGSSQNLFNVSQDLELITS